MRQVTEQAESLREFNPSGIVFSYLVQKGYADSAEIFAKDLRVKFDVEELKRRKRIIPNLLKK